MLYAATSGGGPEADVARADEDQGVSCPVLGYTPKSSSRNRILSRNCTRGVCGVAVCLHVRYSHSLAAYAISAYAMSGTDPAYGGTRWSLLR
eukprot:476696-Rhodomonas_salina.1